VLLDDVWRKHFSIPDGFSTYLGGHTKETYLKLLKEIILGDHAPENVILLEIFPHQQKTRIDFYCTKDMAGIDPVCITELIKEGKQLFYIKDGKKTAIKRIYNRVIFDDLQQLFWERIPSAARPGLFLARRRATAVFRGDSGFE